jgi:hypothetical protein
MVTRVASVVFLLALGSSGCAKRESAAHPETAEVAPAPIQSEPKNDPRDAALPLPVDAAPDQAPVGKTWNRAQAGEIAVKAVAELPDVKAQCRSIKAKHGVNCILYVDHPPEDGTLCAPENGILDPCLWDVYFGSVSSSHASRLVTFSVDVDTGKVVAAQPIACDRMTLEKWRTYAAASAKNPNNPPDCPE